MSDVAIDEQKVIQATGHGREHWHAILESYGDGDHTMRTKRLSRDHPDLDGWWIQTLTVDFERSKGLREVGQSCTGDYQVSCSKTVSGDPVEAYGRLLDAPFFARRDWQEGTSFDLPDGSVQVRRADPGQMLRWFWYDPDGKSTVEVHFQGKPNGKTTLVIRHHQLVSNDARESYRSKWKDVLATIG